MAEFVHVYNDGGGIRNVPMREGATRFTTDRVLHQSGVLFWMPPGDGGSNGLNFTGTNGEFTLSAAVVSAFWNLMAVGGYCYIPAGAGGLAAGWYWCKMTSDTAGTIFAETYPGSGKPAFVSSPTPHSNLIAGRITQLITEVSAFSFQMPGGSMGPNGTLTFATSVFGDSSATNKTYRVRGNSSAVLTQFATSTNSCADYLMSVKNRGVQNAQVGPRSVGVGAGGASVGGIWQYAAIDTSEDHTLTVSMQISANTGSACLAGWTATVQNGA